MSVVFLARQVVTLDRRQPDANALVVVGEHIMFVGAADEARRRAGKTAEVIDVSDATIIPGLIDPHLHLFAGAAQRRSIDCSSNLVGSIPELLAMLGSETTRRRPGEWVRAFGYDHELLAERRHPTRRELDAVSTQHPIRLDHKTGHATVLNSRACSQAGLPTADHDGIFFDSPRTQTVPREELRAATEELSETLLRYGITRVCDAGATNGPSEVQLLDRWRSQRVIKQETALLVGEEHSDLASLPRPGHVGIAGVKFVLEEHGLDESRLDALARLFRRRRADSWIAIHVLELGALAILLDHLELLRDSGVPIRPCRIEHLGLCPPAWMPRLRALGVNVVTQPIFLADRHETYSTAVPPEQHDWLYPATRLIEASVAVAASSDHPVGDMNPFRGMAAAVDRGASRGTPIGHPVPLAREQALNLYTGAAASALSRSADVGRIAPGYRADLAVLDGNPLRVSESVLPELRARLVCVGGEITEIS